MAGSVTQFELTPWVLKVQGVAFRPETAIPQTGWVPDQILNRSESSLGEAALLQLSLE